VLFSLSPPPQEPLQAQHKTTIFPDLAELQYSSILATTTADIKVGNQFSKIRPQTKKRNYSI
jgi:hypothetical protein